MPEEDDLIDSYLLTVTPSCVYHICKKFLCKLFDFENKKGWHYREKHFIHCLVIFCDQRLYFRVSPVTQNTREKITRQRTCHLNYIKNTQKTVTPTIKTKGKIQTKKDMCIR